MLNFQFTIKRRTDLFNADYIPWRRHLGSKATLSANASHVTFVTKARFPFFLSEDLIEGRQLNYFRYQRAIICLGNQTTECREMKKGVEHLEAPENEYISAVTSL